MRIARLAAARLLGPALVLGLAAACGGQGSQPAHSAAPAPRAPAASPTPSGQAVTVPATAIPTTPTPGAPVATDLTFSGAVPAHVASARPLGTCGRAPGGYDVELQFTSQGRTWVLSIGLLDYHGPGGYSIPPERIALHGSGPGARLYPGTGGTVNVNADARTGTIDATLAQGGAHVQGAWACA